MVSKYSIPLSYGFLIVLIGLLGLPSNLFVIALSFNQTAWIVGIQATGFLMDMVFYWAIVHLSVCLYLIIGGIKMLKDTETIKPCPKCKQLQCVCE